MPEELRPVIHRGVRQGLARIKYLRRALIAWFLGWPVAGVLSFEMGIPVFAVFVVWCAIGFALWNLLIWSRCPRCDEFFYPGIVFFVSIFWVFRRRCSQCGLDIRQLNR
jgi:hypothetical protein